MEMAYAVETHGLRKSFGDVRAVKDMTINARKGSVVALLGPNGAGKTTTLNMLTTQLLPDSGAASVLGHDVVEEAKQIRRRIGITFQETSVDLALSGEQVLQFSGELYGMKKRRRNARAHELLEMVGLAEAGKRKTKTYSGGMKRRLELARSLMNSPDLLVLDEPTLGLDPQTRDAVWDYIRKLKQEKGMTILLTTHYMDEAEELADYVYIIDQGTVVKQGEPQSLINGLGDDQVHIYGRGDAQPTIDALSKLEYVQTISSSENGSILIGVDSGQRRVPEILSITEKQGFTIYEVEINKPNLGDVFFSATGREIRE